MVGVEALLDRLGLLAVPLGRGVAGDLDRVVDFVVHRDAMVWPMVAAGVSNDLIQVARDTAPQWDREESDAVEQGLDPDHDGVPSGTPRN